MKRAGSRRLERVAAAARKTRTFLVIVATLGSLQLAASGLSWRSFENPQFLLYFCAAAIASLFPLNRVGDGISLSVPFVVTSIVQLNSSEAVLIGCTAVLIQSLRAPRTGGMGFRIAFSLATQALVIAIAKYILEFLLPSALNGFSVRVIVATLALFIAATIPVAIAVRLNDKERIGKIWKESYSWAFPFYVVSGAMALLVQRATAAATLEDGFLGLTTIFLAHRYYRNHKAVRDSEREYSKQMAALHIRAIEALALSVEAKDNLNTKGHLRRVQAYALAIGREMRLNKTELEALHAGALLHDIGKLAVPDHILTKPGKLSPEEFAKMKVHPLVGAEIVEQMRFPYPVAPIVREHHEKWNGSGYPFGLKGEQISLGARIIAAADCLDALTSDREYRRGMPVEKAAAHILTESGKSFDPRVVEILGRVCPPIALKFDSGQMTELSLNAEVRNGEAPDAGLDLTGAASSGVDAPGFLSAIAAARREDNLLWKVAGSVSALELSEVVSRIHQIVRGMISFDAMAIFLRDAGVLRVEFSAGADAEGLEYLEIPFGEGLAGWVAQRGEPVVNGNPSVDPGFPRAAAETLKSALTIPLAGHRDIVGVLTLYRAKPDAFTGDDLRLLSATTPIFAFALENAAKFTKAQEMANIDPITHLARTDLFCRSVSAELARSKRRKESLCILIVQAHGVEEIEAKLGAPARDAFIAELAHRIKDGCREYDQAARIGMASFALALPWMRKDHLCAVLERIESHSASISVECPVSLTFGGAFYPEDGDGARNLLAVAQHRSDGSGSAWTENIRSLARFASNNSEATETEEPEAENQSSQVRSREQ